MQRAVALYDLGAEFGDNRALSEAITLYRGKVLPLVPRHARPIHWTGTQNNLGNALGALGQRENGTSRLEEAVAAYNAVLAERTRERGPLQWAGTRNNLGITLAALGGRETGTARLEEAAAACRNALEEYVRGHGSLQWAMAQASDEDRLRHQHRRKRVSGPSGQGIRRRH